MSGRLWFIQLSETSPSDRMRGWQDGISDIWHLALTLSVTKTWSYLGTCSGMLYFKYTQTPEDYNFKFKIVRSDIKYIQSSYANTDNSGHETDEGSFWYLGFIWFVWQIQWVTIVGNVCIYREMRLGIKIPELSEALFRKSVLDCKSRGDLCPCSLIGSYPWPLDCNFLWKGLNFGPTWNWWKDAFAIRIIWK